MLPNLPKKRQHKEADVTPAVIAWFEKNYPKSVALEIKVNTNKVLPHQYAALRQVAAGSFAYKLPDMGRRMCYDAFILKQADALTVRCVGNNCEAINVKTNEKILFKIGNSEGRKD